MLLRGDGLRWDASAELHLDAPDDGLGEPRIAGWLAWTEAGNADEGEVGQSSPSHVAGSRMPRRPSALSSDRDAVVGGEGEVPEAELVGVLEQPSAQEASEPGHQSTPSFSRSLA